MKRTVMTLIAGLSIFVSATSFAMMGPGMGPGTGPGMMGHNHPGGMGSGMANAGGMSHGLMLRSISHALLDVLAPVTTAQGAVAAAQSFIDSANSSLLISEIWEYQSVYKAELSDSTGQRAFDLIVEKLTGAVTPEMGLSMMMNASWGKMLHKTPAFKQKLTVSVDEATAAAQTFINNNIAVINYTLAAPETYPGYYKFHTTDTLGNPGMDIMINGFTSGIWMNTLIGAPLAKVM